MKKTVLVIALCTGLVQTISAQQDSVLKLFRSVRIQKGSYVKLGAPGTDYSEITHKVAPGSYSFKKGAFGVADSMGIELNGTGRVYAIVAGYQYEPEFSNDTAYVHEKRKYQRMISPGQEFVYHGAGETYRVTKWTYQETSFELVEVTGTSGKKKVYSVIFDNDLTYEKYKSKIDLHSHYVSLEILRQVGI